MDIDLPKCPQVEKARGKILRMDQDYGSVNIVGEYDGDEDEGFATNIYFACRNCQSKTKAAIKVHISLTRLRDQYSYEAGRPYHPKTFYDRSGLTTLTYSRTTCPSGK